MTLRELLIQRAARLQEWPALSTPGWPTLRYPAFRNRVEGVALGLMAREPPPGSPVFLATGGPWDWIGEVAGACCGLVWSPGGQELDPELLGGPRFNDEAGRQPYHDRERQVTDLAPVFPGLDHGEWLARLRRLNGRLGWDHTTEVRLPQGLLATPEVRGALWSALYAGAHAVLETGPVPGWDPEPFRRLLD